MLFGKNKELRDQVDEWIDDKKFFKKMLTINDEKRDLIINKILSKQEKNDYENFLNIYKKLNRLYYSRKEAINAVKKIFMEIENDLKITNQVKSAAIWEWVYNEKVNVSDVDMLINFARDPKKNNFDTDEYLEKIEQEKKQRTKEKKEEEKKRKLEEELDDDIDEEETEDKDLDDDVDEEDTEDEDFDYDVDEENNEEDTDDDANEEDDEKEYDDVDEEDNEEDIDDDVDKEDENTEDYINNIVNNYDPLKYEFFDLNFTYKSSEIENKIREYLDDEDFDSIDGFTNGFIMFPTLFFDSVFVYMQYKAAESFIDRVDFLKEFIKEALSDYTDKKTKQYLEKGIEAFNGNSEEYSGINDLIDSLMDKADTEEKELKEIKKTITNQWIDSDTKENEKHIKDLVSKYFNSFLFYQYVNIPDNLLDCITKYYPISKDVSLEKCLENLYHRVYAFSYCKKLLLLLFQDKKISSKYIDKIKTSIASLKKLENDSLAYYKTYSEKEKARQERIASMQRREQEIDNEWEEEIEPVRKQPKKQHKPKQQKKSKLKSFMNFVDTLNNLGKSSIRTLYQCSKCGKILKSTSTPQNSTTCIGNNYHLWNKIAEDGSNIYECQKCGLTIGCKSTPQSTTTCINRNYHSWTKIAEKGDNLYECRKCGKTLKCKSTPQSTTTCENRSYHSWNRI